MHRVVVSAVVGGLVGLLSGGHAVAGGLSSVAIYQSWHDEGEPNGQCGDRTSDFATPFGELSEPIKLDTDGRDGGCAYRLAIIDPDGTLASRQWRLTVVFTPQGDVGQCKFPGTRAVPIVRSIDEAAEAWRQPPWLNPIVIDTDERVGGCVLEFQVTGPAEARAPVLDVRYFADGDPGQCPQAGDKVASLGHPAAIIVDTDKRPGGCLFRLRLRE